VIDDIFHAFLDDNRVVIRCYLPMEWVESGYEGFRLRVCDWRSHVSCHSVASRVEGKAGLSLSLSYPIPLSLSRWLTVGP
jgi:hypothetical protein